MITILGERSKLESRILEMRPGAIRGFVRTSPATVATAELPLLSTFCLDCNRERESHTLPTYSLWSASTGLMTADHRGCAT